MTDLTPKALADVLLSVGFGWYGAERKKQCEEALGELVTRAAALDAERSRNRNLEAIAEAAREHGHAASGEYHDSRCSLCAALAVLEEPSA